MSDTIINETLTEDGVRRLPVSLGLLIAIVVALVAVLAIADSVISRFSRIGDVDHRVDIVNLDVSNLRNELNLRGQKRDIMDSATNGRITAVEIDVRSVKDDVKGVRGDVADVNHKVDRLLALAEHSAK